MKVRLGRIALALVGLAVGVGAVIGLREATLTVHHPVDPDSEAVVELRATTKGGERGRTLDDMVDALLLTCRLEVGVSELVHQEHLGGGRYRAVFEPGLNETNRRQLRGCLGDWTVDHVRIDVVSISRP